MSTDFNAVAWTAQDVLTDVYRACRLPTTGTVDYPPTVVLSMATQSLHDWAGHLVSTALEGRLVTTLLRPVASSSLDTAGLIYELPNMSVADTVDAVIYVDPMSGIEKRLEIIPAAMLPLFTRGSDSGSPTGYAFMDGTIQVFPRPTTGGNIKILYQRRHSVLTISTADYGIISNAVEEFPGTGLTSVLMTAIPATFQAGNNMWVDLIEAAAPHRIRLHGILMTSYSNLPSPRVYLQIPYEQFAKVFSPARDALTIYGKTPYISLPMEMREPFTRQVSSRLLAEIGDMPLSMAHDQMATAGAGRIRDMMQPRAKGQPEKLHNPNSLARGGHTFRRRWPGL